MLQRLLIFVLGICLAACGAQSSDDVGYAPEGEWLSHGLSAGEQRHSPLDSIDLDNVSEVGLAFSFDEFLVRGQTHRGAQATPLMEDGVLYFTGAWSVVYAVDARTGEHLWTFDPEADGAIGRVTCCDVVNRGVALSGDAVIVATIDGYLISLNKADGSVRWKRDTFERRDSSYSITGAPRLAGDLVVIGNGGAEFGVRGYVTAYEIETGKQAWRFYTVPGAGPDENEDVTAARATWSEAADWDFGGGGTTWDSMVYDAELGSLYVGTGNGTPWPAWKRDGGTNAVGEPNDNLYLSSIVALNAETGRVRWHYQTTPADSWDYTATQHMILADLDWEGETRKVIMQAPKNGFFYTLDRETGELLKADPFVPVSWADGIDMETGRPIRSVNGDYSDQMRAITPAPAGGHNWPPMAFSPEESLVFIPVLSATLGFTDDDRDRGYVDRARNAQAGFAVLNPSNSEDAAIIGDNPMTPIESRIIAWDPIKGEERWRGPNLPYWAGGVLSTSGGLAIAGGADGKLYFYDAQSGEVAHSIEVGIAIAAPPITYELDGEQYVAVLAGMGGAPLSAPIPDSVSHRYQNRSRLLVFKLGGGPVDLPPLVPAFVPQPIETGLPTDAATIAKGAQHYEDYCSPCHLPNHIPNGFPDLWNMNPAVSESFDPIVLGGAYEYAGMASFADVLDESDTLAIRAYIADSRRRQAQTGEQAEVAVGAH